MTSVLRSPGVKIVLSVRFALNNQANGFNLCADSIASSYGRFSTHLGHQKNLTRMIDTQHSRRLDSLGRLVIPKKLREELGLESGTEYTFYKHEHEGKIYLCIEAPEATDEVAKALELLRQNGYNL